MTDRTRAGNGSGMLDERVSAKPVDSTDISVVIQGPTFLRVGDDTSQYYKCVNSIRSLLPHAEIIISTWEGQPYETEIADVVLRNREPESIKGATGLPWNYNKMVVSTMNGLKHATRKYTLKMRADLTLTDTRLLGSYPPSRLPEDPSFRIFDQPIVITNVFVRDPASHAPLLFHASDIVQFGLTKDMQDLWDRKPFADADIKAGITPWSGIHFLGYTGLRMVPEQALTTSWLSDHGHDTYLPFPGFLSREYCAFSERVLSTNFRVVDWRNSGVVFPRRFFTGGRTLRSIYDPRRFNSLAENYKSKDFARRRYLQIFWQATVLRPFRRYFWVDFLAAVLLWFSPNAFIRTRGAWRTLKALAFPTRPVEAK